MKTGLWEKVSKKGVSYATGKIKIEDKEYKILLFKNAEKRNTNSPDFNITFEETKEEKQKKATDEQVYADFSKEVEYIDESELAF